ncbi:MAG: glycosyltransferase family 4 protein [Planctomyces sp.]|nr:glycosyltransferase family 4 protein [Planctomyces sp.]
MTTRIGILFEYPSLNGGEHSMLAVLKILSARSDIELIAICPEVGRLFDELQSVVSIEQWYPRTSDGVRKPLDLLATELASLCRKLQLNVIHANSLSMARVTGSMKLSNPVRSPLDRPITDPPVCDHGKQSPISPGLRATGHVRDILKLAPTAIRALNGNDCLIAVSNAARDAIVSQGADPNKCQTVYNGIRIPTPAPPNHLLLRSVGIPDHAFVILNAGQVCLRKGQLDLAKAVIRLIPNHPDLHLLHLGERYSSKEESIQYAAEIEQHFENAGLRHHLHLAGFQRNVTEWMQSSSLLVHTARQEPFGRVLLEAAAAGLPIIATSVGGTSEMLRSEIDAVLIPPANVDAIIKAIEGLKRSVDRRNELALSAHARVEAMFSPEVSASQFIRLLLDASGLEKQPPV